MKIRHSTDADKTAISRIHASAFGEEEGDEIVGLVSELLEDETAKPLLSLLAESDGELVGHILFTVVTLRPETPEVSARILAPLAVSSEHQGKGIGGELTKEGLRQLAESGVDLVFVLGHPGYYPGFGFQPAGMLGLEAPYPVKPEHAEAWMVQALKPNVLGRIKGVVKCAEALDQARYWQE